MCEQNISIPLKILTFRVASLRKSVSKKARIAWILQQQVTFMAQQPLFALHATGVTGRGAATSDHAVAGHHDADRI